MEPTLGGRVGLLRYGTQDSSQPRGWQLNFDGAVMPRLDFMGQLDVEAVDYRFGLLNAWSDGQTAMQFGEGSSPALYGDTLVVNWDHEGESYIVALDKSTSEELWRKDRDEGTSWSTPLIIPVDGQPQTRRACRRRLVARP